MMRVLGPRRLLLLFILVALNAAFAAAAYLVFMPSNLEKDKTLRRTRAQVSALQTDIQALQVELSDLETQQAQFETLKDKGFFDTQNRRRAQEILERIQDQANVIKATATVQPGAVEEYEAAQKAEHSVIKSPISIKIEAIDDVGIYKYIQAVQDLFPGDVTISRVSIERKSNITGVLLRGIASGLNPPLVNGEVEVIWRTMIPNSRVNEGSEGP